MDETLRKSGSVPPKVSFGFDNGTLLEEFVAFRYDSMLVFRCCHNPIVRYFHSINNQLSLDLFLKNVFTKPVPLSINFPRLESKIY